jgi:hypothetical protein
MVFYHLSSINKSKHMRLTTPIGAVLIGTLFVLPLYATAQVSNTSGSVRAVVTTRESATGKATGRMMPVTQLPPGVTATGTRILPPRMEEARRQMQEKRSKILKRFAEMMIKRMNAAIDRLTKLADRLDSRIAKEKARGVNTSATEASLALARTKLADARTAVGVAEAAVAGAIASADTSASSTKPVDVGKPVREALNKAKDAVFAAHKALVQAVASLKGTRETNSHATTTKDKSVAE